MHFDGSQQTSEHPRMFYESHLRMFYERNEVIANLPQQLANSKKREIKYLNAQNANGKYVKMIKHLVNLVQLFLVYLLLISFFLST